MPTEPPAPVGPLRLKVYVPPGVQSAVAEIGRRFATEQKLALVLELREVDVYEALRRLGSDGGDLIITEGHGPMEVIRASGVLLPETIRTVTHLPLLVTIAGPRAEALRSLEAIDAPSVTVGIPDPGKSTGAEAARRLATRAGLKRRYRERALPTTGAGPLRDGTVDVFIGYGRIDTGLVLNLPDALGELLPVPAGVFATSRHVEVAKRLVAAMGSELALEPWRSVGTVPRRSDANGPLGPAAVGTILPGKLPEPRSEAASVSDRGRVWLFGGESGGKLLDTITVYDPASYTSKNLEARLPAALSGAAAGRDTATRRIVVAGGYRASNDPGAPVEGVSTRELHRFDVEREVLETLTTTLPSAVGYAATAQLGDVLYLFGGRASAAEPQATPRDVRTADIIAIEVTTGTAQRAEARLPSPRHSASAALGPDGHVWIVGGETDSGPSDEVVRFDASTQQVMTLGPRLAVGLVRPAVVSWPLGCLVAGGRTPRGVTDRVWLITSERPPNEQSVRLPYATMGAAASREGDRALLLGGLGDERVEGRAIRLPE